MRTTLLLLCLAVAGCASAEALEREREQNAADQLGQLAAFGIATYCDPKTSETKREQLRVEAQEIFEIQKNGYGPASEARLKFWRTLTDTRKDNHQ